MILVDESERIVLSYDLGFGGNGDWIVEVETYLNSPANYNCELLLSQASFLFCFDENFLSSVSSSTSSGNKRKASFF